MAKKKGKRRLGRHRNARRVRRRILARAALAASGLAEGLATAAGARGVIRDRHLGGAAVSAASLRHDLEEMGLDWLAPPGARERPLAEVAEAVEARLDKAEGEGEGARSGAGAGAAAGAGGETIGGWQARIGRVRAEAGEDSSWAAVVRAAGIVADAAGSGLVDPEFASHHAATVRDAIARLAGEYQALLADVRPDPNPDPGWGQRHGLAEAVEFLEGLAAPAGADGAGGAGGEEAGR